MVAFVVRRLAISLVVLLLSTYVVYVLTCFAGDPTSDLSGLSGPTRDLRIAQRTELLHLDVSPFLRYFIWLHGIVGFLLPGVDGTFGTNRHGQDVGALLAVALQSTARLVITAALTAVVLGVLVGIVSALRQYSGLDYTITFATFVFYSLPVFWVAVLLKQFGAIRFNRWLGDPVIPASATLVLAVLTGLTCQALVAGSWRRRLLTAAGTGLAAAGILQYLSLTRWFADPALGPAMIAVGAVGAALAATAATAGLRRRTVLRSSLVVALLGVIAYPLTGGVLGDPGWWLLLGLLAISLTVAVLVGLLLGGQDRREAVTAGLLTAVLTGALIVTDHALRALPAYAAATGGRVVATIGSASSEFDGTFWERLLDTQAHAVLPTVTLVLVSFATYARYSRASILEVMDQDYIRTARAKGLPEREVVLHHALRTSMLPVATLVAYDIAAFFGGAIIAEAVFGRPGMGTMFIEALRDVNPDPVMAFFLVTGGCVVVCNLAVDLVYARLDPRIRLT